MEVQTNNMENDSNLRSELVNTKERRVKPINIFILSIIFLIFAGLLTAIVLVLTNNQNPSNNLEYTYNDTVDDVEDDIAVDEVDDQTSDTDDSNTPYDVTDTTEGTLVETDNFSFTCPEGWELYSNSMDQNLFRTYECTLSLENNNFAFNNGIATSFTFIDPAVEGFDSNQFIAHRINIMEGGNFEQYILDNMFSVVYTERRAATIDNTEEEYLRYNAQFSFDRFIIEFRAEALGTAFDNYEPLVEIENILNSFN